MKILQIKTTKKIEAIDITSEIEKEIKNSEKKLATIFCPHTTSALTINEPNAIQDILEAIDEIEPKLDYFHKINAQAHIKSSLIGVSLTIPVEEKLILGKWQKIFFLEFDGPKERQIWINII